ncbi:uncharacterized protein Hap1MRO34_018888 isoform 1-T2 [Clarias gariepinus]|uniref:uncharacterized protein LOC128544045 n=1 Tax=Clarias gariepinus TaxID=13013 RepID=UPI00234D25AA|nr:uncharacterized protein LOC128544045 [Clarias gariepinus]XP_053369965.1 uncharacterized protein LOC128544045 [Clarias gariepinus]
MDLFHTAPSNTLINNLQIAIPTVVGIIISIALCKCLFQCRKMRGDRAQQAQASARAPEPPPAVYTIPNSPTQEQEQRHGPPQYNLPQQYPPPPAYNELMLKPDFPSVPPPAYTEVIGSPINPSAPGQITPSCPPLPQ